jgi:hypothetical protein
LAREGINIDKVAQSQTAYLSRPSISTIIDHLVTLIKTEEVSNRLDTLQPAFERMFQPCIEFLALAGLAILRLKELPPSPGYEPLLIENGFNPIIARGLARVAVRFGKRQAKESSRRRPVCDAIRYLAVPRQKRAIISRGNKILAAWRETSIVETLFDEAGLSETEFIKILEAIVRGEHADHQRLTQLSAVARHITLSRGPKIAASSATHAFLLENDLKLTKKRAPYSRRDRSAENCDSLTEATRIEFAQPHFDSRPAKRRSKARKINKMMGR